jgi:hypothetical protein
MNIPFDIYLFGREMNILNELEKAVCFGTWTCNHDDAGDSANRRNSKQIFEFQGCLDYMGNSVEKKRIFKQIKWQVITGMSKIIWEMELGLETWRSPI